MERQSWSFILWRDKAGALSYGETKLELYPTERQSWSFILRRDKAGALSYGETKLELYPTVEKGEPERTGRCPV